MNLLLDVTNDLTVEVVQPEKSYVLAYIISMIVLFVVSYLLDKSKKIEITDLKLSNPLLITEVCLIPIISSIFGVEYLCFSFYLVYFYYINVQFVNKKIGKDIPPEDDRRLVKEITSFFFKPWLIMAVASIPLSIFAEFNVIFYYFAFFLACVIMIAMRIMVSTNDDSYKLMSNDQVKSLFGEFYTDELFKKCYASYMLIQKNLAANTIDNASTMLSQDMLVEYQNKQKDNLNKKARLIIDEESYISGGLINYKKDNNTEYFYVELVYNIKSYVGDMETGNVISGSSTRLKKITSLMEFNKINDTYILLSEKVFKEE